MFIALLIKAFSTTTKYKVIHIIIQECKVQIDNWVPKSIEKDEVLQRSRSRTQSSTRLAYPVSSLIVTFCTMISPDNPIRALGIRSLLAISKLLEDKKTSVHSPTTATN